MSDECPIELGSITGVPADAVRCARLNRFIAWKYKNDAAFKAEVDKALEDGLEAILDWILHGEHGWNQ